MDRLSCRRSPILRNNLFYFSVFPEDSLGASGDWGDCVHAVIMRIQDQLAYASGSPQAGITYRQGEFLFFRIRNYS